MTLLEVLVAGTIATILLGVVITVADQLRHHDRRIREDGGQADQLVNLARSIRTDMRNASNVSQPEKRVLAIAAENQHEIRYELAGGSCRRVEKTESGPPARVDTFAIGPAASWKLESATPGRRPAYTIRLDMSEKDNVAVRFVPFFLYAPAGNDAS